MFSRSFIACSLAISLALQPLQAFERSLPTSPSHNSACSNQALTASTLWSAQRNPFLGDSFAGHLRRTLWASVLLLSPVSPAKPQGAPVPTRTSADLKVFGLTHLPLPLRLYTTLPADIREHIQFIDQNVRQFQDQFTIDEQGRFQSKEGADPYPQRVSAFYGTLGNGLLNLLYRDSLSEGWKTQQELEDFQSTMAAPEARRTNLDRMFNNFAAQFYARHGLYFQTSGVPTGQLAWPVTEMRPVTRIETPTLPAAGKDKARNLEIYYLDKSLVRLPSDVSNKFSRGEIALTRTGTNQIFIRNAEWVGYLDQEARLLDLAIKTPVAPTSLRNVGRSLRVSAIVLRLGKAPSKGALRKLIEEWSMSNLIHHEGQHVRQGLYLEDNLIPWNNPRYNVWKEADADIKELTQSANVLYAVGTLFEAADRVVTAAPTDNPHAQDLPLVANRLGYSLWRKQLKGWPATKGFPPFDPETKAFSSLPSDAQWKILKAFKALTGPQLAEVLQTLSTEMSKVPNPLTEGIDLSVSLKNPTPQALPTRTSELFIAPKSFREVAKPHGNPIRFALLHGGLPFHFLAIGMIALATWTTSLGGRGASPIEFRRLVKRLDAIFRGTSSESISQLANDIENHLPPLAKFSYSELLSVLQNSADPIPEGDAVGALLGLSLMALDGGAQPTELAAFESSLEAWPAKRYGPWEHASLALFLAMAMTELTDEIHVDALVDRIPWMGQLPGKLRTETLTLWMHFLALHFAARLDVMETIDVRLATATLGLDVWENPAMLRAATHLLYSVRPYLDRSRAFDNDQPITPAMEKALQDLQEQVRGLLRIPDFRDKINRVDLGKRPLYGLGVNFVDNLMTEDALKPLLDYLANPDKNTAALKAALVNAPTESYGASIKDLGRRNLAAYEANERAALMRYLDRLVDEGASKTGQYHRYDNAEELVDKAFEKKRHPSFMMLPSVMVSSLAQHLATPLALLSAVVSPAQLVTIGNAVQVFVRAILLRNTGDNKILELCDSLLSAPKDLYLKDATVQNAVRRLRTNARALNPDEVDFLTRTGQKSARRYNTLLNLLSIQAPGNLISHSTKLLSNAIAPELAILKQSAVIPGTSIRILDASGQDRASAAVPDLQWALETIESAVSDRFQFSLESLEFIYLHVSEHQFLAEYDTDYPHVMFLAWPYSIDDRRILPFAILEEVEHSHFSTQFPVGDLLNEEHRQWRFDRKDRVYGVSHTAYSYLLEADAALVQLAFGEQLKQMAGVDVETLQTYEAHKAGEIEKVRSLLKVLSGIQGLGILTAQGEALLKSYNAQFEQILETGSDKGGNPSFMMLPPVITSALLQNLATPLALLSAVVSPAQLVTLSHMIGIFILHAIRMRAQEITPIQRFARAA